MAGTPQRLMRRVAQVAFALLLLAPLVAGAHVHGFGTDASAACGVCTVAKHAPAIIAADALAVAVTHRMAVAVRLPQAPSCAECCRRPAGRAPPVSSARQLA